jgi:hypothetical protein
MSPKILSTLELTGVEKIFCTHGAWLKICHAAHLTGDQSVIIKNIHFVIPHLLKRHSRMRSRLQINGYQHSLQILDYDEEYFNPNLFYSIIETTDQSWQKIAENECHRNPYSDDGKTVFPLFHFMLILNENFQLLNDDNLFHLLLFSNHCAADGRSGLILINDFLTLITSSNLHDRIEPINTEVIPCITQLIPRPYRILYPIMLPVVQYIYKRELRQLNHPRIPVKTTLVDGELTPYRFQRVKLNFLFTSTSTTLYSRLREKCHSQQVTLHGPLFACLVLAIHHCFPIENKNNTYFTPPSIDLDFDMRSRLPDSPLTTSTVGYCVGIGSIKFNQRLSLVSTRFWTLAKKCVAMTNKCLTSGEINFIQHFFNDTLKNEEDFNKFATCFPDGRVSEVNFSNIGKYPYSCDYNQGQLRLRGLHVINSAGIYHTSSVLLVTCAGDGQLDISLANEIESEQKAQEFLDYYVHLIEKCADADTGITLEQLLRSVEQ